MIRLVDLLKENFSISLDDIEKVKANLQHQPYKSTVNNLKELEKIIKKFNKTIQKYIKGNTITLYRAVAADSESEIDKTSFGIFWAAEEYYAQVYERDEEMSGMGLYLITADFKLDDINWKETLESFIKFGFMETEVIVKTQPNYKSVPPIKFKIERQATFD
jgi:hypothetical protein